MLVILAACAAQVHATNVMRVMTFNLRYASASDGANNWANAGQRPERREVVAQVLGNHAPDVVGFQEGEDVQLDYLAARLPDYGFERRKPSGGQWIENAAFAWNTNRLELLDRGVFSLGPAPGGSYWNNPPGTNFDPGVFFPDMGANFPRLALWGHFRWRPTGQEFFFYTTHFDFNETPQVRSAALITDDARSRSARRPLSPLAIVVGDFNSSHQDRSWALFIGSYSSNGITGDFKDSWYEPFGSWFSSGTIHGFAGGTPAEDDRIDWILHRGGFTSLTAQVLYDAVVATNLANGTTRTQYPSDHYPVLARLRLPDPAPDFDGDGLPDAAELAAPNALPTDADTDNDGLVDGLEDLDGDGVVEGGETDPGASAPAQLPTDIRNYPMDGVRDHPATLLGSHGLDLYYRFDGRYLYVATQDAGEGNDHFIFVSTNPASAVSAPWAKAGQVGAWLAFLADEDGGGFSGWFDAGRNLITNLFAARSATYFQNGGRLEGVLDLSTWLPVGFTSALYVAAAPYGTADGGSLVTSAQVPAGNGDGDLLGADEYIRLNPGDADGDGVSDAADPDADGDGLPDVWAQRFALAGGGTADADGDGSSNRHELEAGTDPTNAASVLKLDLPAAGAWRWPAPWGKTSVLARRSGADFGPAGTWSAVSTVVNTTVFPARAVTSNVVASPGYLRVEQSP